MTKRPISDGRREPMYIGLGGLILIIILLLILL
jgi:hypothetical protein